MSATEETSAAATPPARAVQVDPLFNLVAGRRKERLLPVIAELALDGLSGHAIAHRLGVPKRTVNHWLQELRKEWISQGAQSTAEVLGVAFARLDTIYREAMQAWRSSLADHSVEVKQESGVDGGGSGGRLARMTSTRTESRQRNAAYLARATHAAVAKCRLQGGGRASPGRTAGTESVLRALEALTEDQFKGISQDQLCVIMSRLSAVILANRGSVPILPEGNDRQDALRGECLAGAISANRNGDGQTKKAQEMPVRQIVDGAKSCPSSNCHILDVQKA